MADWKDFEEEKQSERVPSNRFERMFKMGSTGARVAASSFFSKAKSMLPLGDEADRAEQLERAFEDNAQVIADVLGELKGASLKVGQLLSADPELLPDGFSEVIAQLQKDAPPMRYETVVGQIERSLGRDLQSVFTYFSDEPIGSASIGQVHRATLDSGEDVAVKVQYPGVVEALESDLKMLKSLLVYGRLVVDKGRLEEYFDEVRDFVILEADYETEAANMERFREILGRREGFRAPRPFPKWTTDKVLVMEYVEGEKLDEALAEREENARQALLERWVRTYMWLFHEVHELHADPHPGNFLLTDDDRIVMLDYGAVKAFEPSFADGMLEIMVSCWENDDRRAVELYRELGFAADEADLEGFDPELLRGYHDIILEPFLTDGPFDFGGWSPAMRGKKYMMRHPSFLKIVPPQEAMLYLRTLSGIKGLLNKLDAALDVNAMARQIAERRGLWTSGE